MICVHVCLHINSIKFVKKTSLLQTTHEITRDFFYLKQNGRNKNVVLLENIFCLLSLAEQINYTMMYVCMYITYDVGIIFLNNMKL